jgi:FSR family fosmidomycin resistance protein-like MFS transporter
MPHVPRTSAPDGAPPPDAERFHSRRVLTIAGAHAAHDTYTAFLAPLLPVFITSFGLSKTEAGLLAVFLQLPWLLQPVIGHLADISRAELFVIAAPGVSAIAMCLLGIAPGYAVLVSLLLLAGVSSAGFHAVGPALVSQLSGRSLGRGMGIWMVGGELGRTLGPVIAVTAVEVLTRERMPWLMVGGIAFSGALFARLRNDHPPVDTTATRLPWRQLVRSMRPVLLPLAGIMFLRAFLVAALNLYLPVFLSERGASLWLAGSALSVLEAAGVAGALAGGTISDRIGRRLTLALSLTATPLLTFVFLGASGWVQIALLVLLGLTGLSVTPVIMAVVQESFPGNRALANSLYMMLSYVIRSVAVVSLGALGDTVGLGSGYAISAGLALLGLPLVRYLPRRRSAVTTEDSP